MEFGLNLVNFSLIEQKTEIKLSFQRSYLITDSQVRFSPLSLEIFDELSGGSKLESCWSFLAELYLLI